jgi:benzodiazapine receptor
MPDLVLPPAISTPLWFALALAFAVAGWRMWTIDANSTETRLWLAIQIISWWFSPVFFIMRSPLFAFILIVVLAGLMAWFIARTWGRDRVSAYLFIPSFIYILYVAAMTGAIVAMN